MKPWRPAPVSVLFGRELDAAYPNRERPDGTIGDDRPEHQTGGHAVDGDGLVVARDVYARGVDMWRVIPLFLAHESANYCIHKGTIWDVDVDNGRPRKYHGRNPHDTHGHFEFRHGAPAYSGVSFGLTVKPMAPAPAPLVDVGAIGGRTLRLTQPFMAGRDVGYVQRFIGPAWCGPSDGVYGPKTLGGVRRYQGMRGLAVDGVVGPNTWWHILHGR